MSDITLEQQNKKSRLGRGLGSLLGEQAQPLGPRNSESPIAKVASPAPTEKPLAEESKITPEAMTKQRVWNLAIDKLKPSSAQPRRHFDKAKLEELAQSIKSSGILQPILTRKGKDGNYEIIAGERRWRASQLAGLHEVPVLVQEIDDNAALEIALIENIQREDLNPIEEAEAYFRLSTEFRLTQAQVADKVGKDRVTVANMIRLLQLDPQVKELLAKGAISQGHAKVLLTLPQLSAQRTLAERIIKESLTVRQLEKAIKDYLNPVPQPEVVDDKAAVRATLVKSLQEEVQKSLSTKVVIDYKSGKGQIQIHFYSDDELTKLTDKLKGAR